MDASICVRSLFDPDKLSLNASTTFSIQHSRYDVMGDMVFGGGFETMRDGAKNAVIINVIQGGLK